jgi:mono/diheme cytochrome c family protein
VFQRAYDVPRVSLTIPTDAAAIAEGRRLATIRGCFGGCHGKEAEGKVMFDKPMIAHIVAPDLTRAVRKYSDADLAAAIRHGVRPSGRSMIAMPSEAFVALSDEDLGRIIAFLKSLPPTQGPGPDVSAGPLGRLGLVTGRFKVVAQLVAEGIPPPEVKVEQGTQGRYLARTTCAQCHGTDLRGASNPSFTAPDLRVVKSYSADAFTQLLRTGAAIGGRTTEVMSEWSRGHLSQLNDSEITALHRYLQALP